MTGKFFSIKAVSLVLRVLGWLFIGLVVSMLLAKALLFFKGKPFDPKDWRLVGLGSLYGALNLAIGYGLKIKKEWARQIGFALAVIDLFYFPIGTVFGFYICVCLWKGWDVVPA